MTLTDGYDTHDVWLRLIRRWPWLMAALCVGGLVGLGLSRLLPPVYEAVAVVGVGIDYGRTLPLDEEAMRHALDRTREVFLADETLEGVLKADDWAGRQFENSNALRDTLRLSEVGGGWELAVRARSPEDAARVANAWASASLEALQRATQHAWRAGELQAKWYFAACKLQPAATPSLRAAWSCSVSREEYDPDQALTELEREAVLSYGVLPSMSFALLREADAPTEPLTTSRLQSALAGLLAGAVIGVASACAWPERRTRP